MPALPDPLALREIPLFAGLEPPMLSSINEKLRKHRYATGTTVITADTPGESVFIIYQGTVKIKADQPNGREVIVAILGAGALVGEMSLIDRQDRSADVVTQEESILLWLDRQTFSELVNNEPVVGRNLLGILTRRLRLSTEQIQALCTLDVYGRVARQLLAFADLYGRAATNGIQIPIRLTQSDIAGLVGASRERVNQVFVALKDSKLIISDASHRITILDDKRLREILQRR
jgi:CRP-like cAMP-binding protein